MPIARLDVSASKGPYPFSMDACLDGRLPPSGAVAPRRGHDGIKRDVISNPRRRYTMCDGFHLPHTSYLWITPGVWDVRANFDGGVCWG